MTTKQFILAGKAIFTISNGRTGADAADYTYRVSLKKADDPRYGDTYFIGLLTGPSNLDDYTYLGILDAETARVRLTTKSAYPADSKPVLALGWALKHVWAGATELPHGATIQHAGRCGKCAKVLTVPESIETGLGPECSGKGYTKPRNERRAVHAPSVESDAPDAPAPTEGLQPVRTRAARGAKKAAADALATAVEAVREAPEHRVEIALGRAFGLSYGENAASRQAKVVEALRTFADAGALTLGELIAAGKLVTAHFTAVSEAAASHVEAA